jgi:hypothetical protein
LLAFGLQNQTHLRYGVARWLHVELAVLALSRTFEIRRREGARAREEAPVEYFSKALTISAAVGFTTSAFAIPLLVPGNAEAYGETTALAAFYVGAVY